MTATSTLNLRYSITTNEGEITSVLVFAADDVFIATPEHPNFSAIVDALESDEPPDPQSLIDLFDVTVGVAKKFERLSERVTVAHGRIYFDGVQVDSALANTIAKFYAAHRENDFMPLVNFLEKIEQNPNPHSREHLFRWIDQHNFMIAPDGDIVAYKGVNLTSGTDRYESSNSGTAIVNGEVKCGKIPTSPGTIVEMPRDQVQFDPRNGCSTGLHVGNWSFASTFAAATLRVKVNPRDVVSVPVDSGERKMRVCRYRVLSRVTAEDRTMLFTGEAMKTLVAEAKPVQRAFKPSKKQLKATKVVAAVTPGKAGKTRKAIAKGSVPKGAVKAKAKPHFYESFVNTDFMEMSIAKLQWLAKEWGVPSSNEKSTLVTTLAGAASKRKFLANAKKTTIEL